MRFMSLLLMVCVLAGCGGGGGGGSSLTPMEPAPPIMPPPTEAELRSRSQAIFDAANVVVATDSVLVTNIGEIGRFQTVCGDSGCTTVSPVTGLPTTFTAENAPLHEAFEDTNFADISWQNEVVLAASRWIVRRDPDTSAYGLGGWLDHNFFAAHILELRNADTGLLRALGVSAYSLGDATGTNPITGSATWTGAMAGIDVSEGRESGLPVAGNATATFDFANVNLDVALTNIRDLDREQSYADMRWEDLRVRQGRFGTGGDMNSIQGQFYGPNHEEVGGVFERNEIIGAFGAKR